jgi:predicted thioredoxin/glutaredoxin
MEPRKVPGSELPGNRPRATVKVCVHATCCMRGSEKIYEELDRGLSGKAEVVKTAECFRFCESGPNVAVDGNVLKGMRPGDAVARVRREMGRPSRKIDGVGSRSIDELDDVLDGLML